MGENLLCHVLFDIFLLQAWTTARACSAKLETGRACLDPSLGDWIVGYMIHFPIFLIKAGVLQCLDISCSWQSFTQDVEWKAINHPDKNISLPLNQKILFPGLPAGEIASVFCWRWLLVAGFLVWVFLLLKNTTILKGALGNLKLRMFTQFIAQYNFWLIEFEVSLAAGSRGSKEQETTFWILSPKRRCCNDSIACKLAGLFIWETEEQRGCFLGTGWSLCVGLKKPDPSGAAVPQAVKLCTHCTLRKRQS